MNYETIASNISHDELLGLIEGFTDLLDGTWSTEDLQEQTGLPRKNCINMLALRDKMMYLSANK